MGVTVEPLSEIVVLKKTTPPLLSSIFLNQKNTVHRICSFFLNKHFATEGPQAIGIKKNLYCVESERHQNKYRFSSS